LNKLRAALNDAPSVVPINALRTFSDMVLGEVNVSFANGTRIRALLDTGAAKSFLSKSIAETLPEWRQREKLAGWKIVTADGSTAESFGHINASFACNNITFKHDFIVLSERAIPMIIGLDFLRAHKAAIMLEDSSVVLAEGTLKIKYRAINETKVAALVAKRQKAQTKTTKTQKKNVKQGTRKPSQRSFIRSSNRYAVFNDDDDDSVRETLQRADEQQQLRAAKRHKGNAHAAQKTKDTWCMLTARSVAQRKNDFTIIKAHKNDNLFDLARRLTEIEERRSAINEARSGHKASNARAMSQQRATTRHNDENSSATTTPSSYERDEAAMPIREKLSRRQRRRLRKREKDLPTGDDAFAPAASSTPASYSGENGAANGYREPVRENKRKTQRNKPDAPGAQRTNNRTKTEGTQPHASATMTRANNDGQNENEELVNAAVPRQCNVSADPDHAIVGGTTNERSESAREEKNVTRDDNAQRMEREESANATRNDDDDGEKREEESTIREGIEEKAIYRVFPGAREIFENVRKAQAYERKALLRELMRVIEEYDDDAPPSVDENNDDDDDGKRSERWRHAYR
jgi:hypothetical protein